MPNAREEKRRIHRHIENLNSPDEKISILAEQYLIRYYGNRALEQLLAACTHSNPVVRFRAVWALGKTRDPRAFEGILRLTEDIDERVRHDAVLALGKLGDERAIPHLRLISEPPDPTRPATTALMEMGVPGPGYEVLVYGAYGHTGRFVVKELLRRRTSCVISGRDQLKLEALSRETGLSCIQLEVTDYQEFEHVLSGKAALINCAGPFLDTAPVLVEQAIRSGVPYFDIAAEQKVVHELFSTFKNVDVDSTIVPGVAFYGQLGELLIAETLGDMTDADVTLAIGLDSWEPTEGTRLTGAKNPGLRRYLVDGSLLEREPFPGISWNFKGSLEEQAMLSLSLSEAVLVERSKKVKNLRVYINKKPVEELLNPSTPKHTPRDDFGASSQEWSMEVEVNDGKSSRKASLTGKDIYAVSGQLVVHAMQTLLANSEAPKGIHALSRLVDPSRFLNSFIASSE